jgi:hypothetical protein
MGKTIDQIAAAATLTGLEELPVWQAGATVKATLSSLAAYVGSTNLPNPSPTTLGGVKSIAQVSHQWVSYIDTSGTPHLAQPSTADIAGLGSIATQAASSVALTGGTIDGVVIGGTTKAAGSFTSLSATGTTTLSGTLAQTSNRVLAGSGGFPYLPSNAFLFQQIGVSGTVTGSEVPLNLLAASDTATNTSSVGTITLLQVALASGAGMQGSRIATNVSMLYSGGGANSGGTSIWAGNFVTTASGNDGGTSGGLGNLKGSLWGINSQAYLQAGATYYNFICAHEFDIGVATGASAGIKVGLNIVQASDAVQGIYDDVAISINGMGAGWLTGLGFGSKWSSWPFAASATLIAAVPNTLTVGYVNNLSAAIGLDFSPVTFSQYSLKLPGMTVAPTGALTAYALSSTTTINATGAISSTASVAASTSLSAGTYLSVGSYATIGGNLTVSGATTLSNLVTITGAVTLQSSLAGAEAGVFSGSVMTVPYTFLLGGISPTAEYQALYGGSVWMNSGVTGGVAVPSGATVLQNNAVSGFVSNASTGAYAVAGFFQARSLATGAHVWGLNPVVDDRGHQSTLQGIEIDVNTTNSSTTATALNIGGVWSSGTHANTNAIVVQAPTNSSWTTAFLTADGATGTAMQIGASGSVANSAGQFVTFSVKDASATNRTAYLQATAATAGANLVIGVPTGTAAVSGNFSVSGTSVLSGLVTVSNNATVGGTLVVTGGTTVGSLSSNATISATGAISSSASVTATTSLSSGTYLSVGSYATIAGNLTVSGTASFTAGGTVGGTFAGAATLSGAVTLSASGTALSVTNNVSVGGTLGVTGAATLSGGGTLSGTFAGTPTLSGALALSATGTALSVTNNASIGGTLSVTGAGSFAGAVSLTGSGTALAVSNNATVGGTLAVAGAGSFAGDLSLTGTGTGLAVTNNATIGGTLGVTGGATLSGGGAFNGSFSGAPTFSGAVTLSAASTALAVINNATIGGTLGVTGAATVGSLASNGGITATGAISTSSSIAASTSLNAGTYLNVTTYATIGGNLAVTGAGSFAAILSATASGTGLSVTNNATIGGSLSVGGASIDASLQLTAPATGATVTIPNNIGRYAVNPTGTLASLTLIMPSTPQQNQVVAVLFTQAVTALTLNGNSGQTVSSPPTSAAAGTSIRYCYTGTTWLREQ